MLLIIFIVTLIAPCNGRRRDVYDTVLLWLDFNEILIIFLQEFIGILVEY
jgi:hypothetical protein